MSVQSVIFRRDKWTVPTARRWLKQHDFAYDSKVDSTVNFHRFRQYSPKRTEEYRTRVLPGGIELIIGMTRR